MMTGSHTNIVLYGGANTRAFRVIWMLRELRLPFEHHSPDFMGGDLQNPDFLHLNPNGRIPTLVDGGESYWESLSINLYLASTYGGKLAPKNTQETARAVQWSLWAANELETPMLVVLCNRKMFLPEYRDPQEEKVALQKIARPLNALETVLNTSSHVIADRFSVADLNIASVMIFARLAELDLSAWPKIDAWLSQSLARPHAAGYESMLLPPSPRPPFWASIVM
jgi:glutathione S-transferase